MSNSVENPAVVSNSASDPFEPLASTIRRITTGKAEDFGYVAVVSPSNPLFDDPKGAWRFSSMTVPVVEITHEASSYGFGGHQLRRLTDNEAAAFISDRATLDVCHPDPTGEIWSNIFIDALRLCRGETTPLSNSGANARQLAEFVGSGMWGNYVISGVSA